MIFISFTELVVTHCRLHLLRDNVRTWNWTTCQGYQTAIISMKDTEEDCKIPNRVSQLAVIKDLEWLDVHCEYHTVLTLLHIIASLKFIRTKLLRDGAKIQRCVGIKCQLAHGLKLDSQDGLIRSESRSLNCYLEIHKDYSWMYKEERVRVLPDRWCRDSGIFLERAGCDCSPARGSERCYFGNVEHLEDIVRLDHRKDAHVPEVQSCSWLQQR